MNDYYVNIGAQLAERFEISRWTEHAAFPRQYTNNFTFRIIKEKECSTIVKQIDITKSSAIKDIKLSF